jgi:propionyl-CoA carboxylase beta chain
MSSKHVRANINFAYPTAEIAVMGPEGAVNIIARKEIEQAEDPEAERARLTEEYRERFANPYRAADLGFIDEVIRPEDTRPRVISAFEMLEGKRQTNPPKKHGNIPL